MGRRAILLLTSVAVMVAVSAGFALGAAIVGTNGPDNLQGTANGDKIAGAGQNDNINGLAGQDQLSGDTGSDDVNGGPDRDIVQASTAGGTDTGNGGEGDLDWVSVADRDTNDLAVGGPGAHDTCVFDVIVADNGMGGETTTSDDVAGSCEEPRRVITDVDP